MPLIYRIFILTSLLFIGQGTNAQTLPEYLNAAHSNSPVFLENQHLAAIANLEIEKTKAANQKPEVKLTGDFLYAPVVNDYGYDEGITNGSLYSALVNIDQPLLTRPQVQAQVRNSTINQAIYAQQSWMELISLDSQVTDQYIQVYQNLEHINYTRQVLDILEQQEKVVRVFAENAIMSQSDLLFFEIEKKKEELALLDYRRDYVQGLADLNLLVGRVDTSLVFLEEPSIQLHLVPADISNFRQTYLLDSLLAASEQEISELKYHPQLSVFANAGLNAVMLKGIYKRFGFSVGANFSYLLYDGNQREITRQQTQLRQETIQAKRAYFLNKIRQERQANLQQIALLDDKIQELEAQLQQYETLLKFYGDRIAQGELSVNDYINAIKSFTETEADYTTAKTSRLLLINTYNYWNW